MSDHTTWHHSRMRAVVNERVSKSCLCVVALLLVGSPTARADEHAPHPHHAALFVGVSSLQTHAHRSADLTIGAEYELRLPIAHRAFGIGPIVEMIIADQTSIASLGTAYLHPWRGIKLFAGAGLEHAHGENHGIWRGGVAYDWHLGDGACVTPTGSVDRVEAHTVLVAGITIGYGF